MNEQLFKFLQNEASHIKEVLQEFKVQKCAIQEDHQHDICKYYHNDQDQRRDPYSASFYDRGFKYSNELCMEIGCKHKENCGDCNNKYEVKFHPMNYKTGKKCENYSECEKPREYCPNLHIDELNRNLQEQQQMQGNNQQEQEQNLENNPLQQAQQQQGISQQQLISQIQKITQSQQQQQNEFEQQQQMVNNSAQNQQQQQQQQQQAELIQQFSSQMSITNQNSNGINSNNSQDFNGIWNNLQMDVALQQQQRQQGQQQQQSNNNNQGTQQQQQQQNLMYQIPLIQQWDIQSQGNNTNNNTNQYQQQSGQPYQQQNQSQQQQQSQQLEPQQNLQQQQQQNQNSQGNQRQQKQFYQQQNQHVFDLDIFKTKLCPKQGNHNLKHCIYFHKDHDRRRPPSQYEYSFDICPYLPNCQMGDKCSFSHNKVEQLYHKSRYKSKFCSSYPSNVDQCEYGEYCSFAHNDEEITIELIHKYERDDNFNVWHYKTVWCPYTYNHDRGQCPYAHNVQDYRRNPQIYKLDPEDCILWNKSDNVTLYSNGGCPKLMDCKKCHGWKELEYHPQVYKTRNCTNGQNCKKKDCAYFHYQKDNKDKKFIVPKRKCMQSQNQYDQHMLNLQYKQIQVENQGMPINVFTKHTHHQNSKKGNSNFNQPIKPTALNQQQQQQTQKNYNMIRPINNNPGIPPPPPNMQKSNNFFDDPSNYGQQQSQSSQQSNNTYRIAPSNLSTQCHSYKSRDNSNDSSNQVFSTTTATSTHHNQVQQFPNFFQPMNNSNMGYQNRHYQSDGEIDQKRKNKSSNIKQLGKMNPNSLSYNPPSQLTQQNMQIRNGNIQKFQQPQPFGIQDSLFSSNLNPAFNNQISIPQNSSNQPNNLEALSAYDIQVNSGNGVQTCPASPKFQDQPQNNTNKNEQYSQQQQVNKQQKLQQFQQQQQLQQLDPKFKLRFQDHGLEGQYEMLIQYYTEDQIKQFKSQDLDKCDFLDLEQKQKILKIIQQCESEYEQEFIIGVTNTCLLDDHNTFQNFSPTNKNQDFSDQQLDQAQFSQFQQPNSTNNNYMQMQTTTTQGTINFSSNNPDFNNK